MRSKTLIRLARLWASLFYRFEAHGVENIPAEGPCIIGCNHPGKLLGDMFAVLAVLRRRVPTVVAPQGGFRSRGLTNRNGRGRGEELAVRLLRAGVKRLPTVGITRLNHSPVSQNLAMLQALERGEAVFLAVEGEVSWDGRLNPARRGAAWMALRSGAPFVPCGLTGTYDVWPRWRPNPHLTGKVIVRFGRPFRLSEEAPGWIEDAMLEQAGQQIMAAIGELVGRATA
jgi:1-acyl-sn-glycerol-3-phosphate acyltransferase